VRHVSLLALVACTLGACALDFGRFAATGTIDGGQDQVPDADLAHPSADAAGDTSTTSDDAAAVSDAGVVNRDGEAVEAGAPADGSVDAFIPCRTSAACSNPTSVCNVDSGACVGCLTSADCGPALPYCDTTTSQCVGCLTSTNCNGTPTPYCSANMQCVQCLQNSQCPMRNQCVDGMCR
jgi:hypothetical protein